MYYLEAVIVSLLSRLLIVTLRPRSDLFPAMDGVSGSNQRMVLRSSSAPSTAQGQKLREHSMDEGPSSSGFHNQTLSTHAQQVFSPQQLPAASAPPAQRECHSSEHDSSPQPSAPPVPDTPVEASRVSISNEDNVLLDPEVLVEFSQQALALTILATLVRCTTDENEVRHAKTHTKFLQCSGQPMSKRTSFTHRITYLENLLCSEEEGRSGCQ